MSQPKVTLQLRNQCMWSPSFEAKYIYLMPNIYLWSQIYAPEAWGSGAPRVAGSRISFPFPLAPALFSPAGMKFEESLNIRLRDGEGVVLLLARKSIFFDEVYVFFSVDSRQIQEFARDIFPFPGPRAIDFFLQLMIFWKSVFEEIYFVSCYSWIEGICFA